MIILRRIKAVKTPFQRHLLAGAMNHNTQCINNIITYINVKRVDLKSIYYLCIWGCCPGATLTIVPTKKIRPRKQPATGLYFNPELV